jgi:two-component system phosphate regulon sensor histidine kinase PhoR
LTRIRTLAGSFRARLVVGYVLIAAVFAIAWVWSLYAPLTQAALRQQTRNLTAVARAGALVAEQPDATPRTIADELVANTDLRLTIVGADGKVLADSESDPATMENHLGRPEIRAALSGQVGTDRRVSKTQGIDQLYVAVPATVDGQSVALRVSQPFTEIDTVARRSRQVGLWLLAAAVIIAVFIAAWASAAASRPVAELSEVAGRMAAGNLSVEVPEVPGDLQMLANSLTALRNQMRARIDALESEQRTLRTTLDGLTDAVFLLDRGVIQYANGAAGRLFRCPPAGWRKLDIRAAGLPEPVSAAIVDGLGRVQPQTAELDPDPRGTTYRLLVVPLDGERAIAVVSDVTERARLDRVRRDFVANASHELKTPVAGIQLLAESAENASSDGDIDMALIFTRQIEAEAARLKRLVGDLLDLSRLDSAPEPGSIADIRLAVDNAVVSHRSAASRKGLTLDVDLSPVRGQDVFAAADVTDVAIALDNLVDNAIAYTETGSVRVRVKASDAFVTIKVSDTGPGIAEEHLPRLFERFYRVDRARSRESGGTGLGLALVKHVVERSNGTVTVASTMGEGTTFTVILPRAS